MALVYSCCFWFSLRLGGILIGLFSLLQALLILTLFWKLYNKSEEVQIEITNWIENIHLLYMKYYLEIIKIDPKAYITDGIVIICVYISLCLLYIYGVYRCSNMLMLGYLVAELIRLVFLSVVIATWLLVLKQNTMDIGLLIGASVAGGFFLLGMFYLWVCATNLPILIREMEREEHDTTVAKLQQLIAAGNAGAFTNGPDDIPLPIENTNPYRRRIFTVPQHTRRNFIENPIVKNTRIPVSRHTTNIIHE